MKKYFVSFLVVAALISCDKKSKVEKEVEAIPVELKVDRFDKAFFESNPNDLARLKAEYPFFFPDNGTPDEVWIEKMQNKDWRDLYNAVEKKYPNFNEQTAEIEELFKHFKIIILKP